MSKLHAGDGKDVPVGYGQSAIVADFLDYPIKGTEGYMVSNGNSGITIDKTRRISSIGDKTPSLWKVWV